MEVPNQKTSPTLTLALATAAHSRGLEADEEEMLLHHHHL